MKKTKSNKRKSIIIKYIAIIVILAAMGFIVVFWLLGHAPKAYVPQTADRPDEVSPYLTHRLGPDFFNQVQLDEPFELLVEQAGLNDILCRGTWPRRFGDVQVGTPVIVFDKGSVYLMSQIGYYGLSSVVTVTARPVQDERGRLNLNIRSVCLGLVPVTGIAARIAEKSLHDSLGMLEDYPELKPVLQAVVANVPFEPVFTFSKQRVWVQEFGLDAGQLRLRLVPENKAVYKY